MNTRYTKKSIVKRSLRSILVVGRDFCKETNIHGFNHISADKRHWIERVLWLLIVSAAIWGAVEIALGQLQRYNENPTVVTLEKDFRTWNYSLPSVTMCDLNRVDETKLPSVIKSFWNVTEEQPQYKYYSRFVATVANSKILELSSFQEYKDDKTLNVDLYQLAVEVMPPPQVRAAWSVGASLRWIPVMTEAGACYTINSRAIADIAIDSTTLNETGEIPITCKNSKLSCYAIFEVTKTTDFYFHSPYDVLDGAVSPSRVNLTLRRQIELDVMEIRSGGDVRDLSPHRRRCLYTDEPTSAGKKVYSTNSCRLSCRSRLALKYCGCKPFYYVREAGPSCTAAGMSCLSVHGVNLTKFDASTCSCSQQCVDAVFKELSVEDKYWGNGPFANQGALRFTMKAPMTRYTRQIVFHFHDLVVSFGGAAGLFLGASFISLVEIIYFVFARMTKCFAVNNEPKQEVTLKKINVLPHEAARVIELTAILDEQKRMEQVYLFDRKYNNHFLNGAKRFDHMTSPEGQNNL